MTEINSQSDALCALKDYSGQTILSESFAREIAAQFDVELNESIKELRPLSEMDRLQPDNDALGIGCGTLCHTLADRLGLDAEDFVAAGHGFTEDGLKDRNLPKIEAYVTEDAA